MIDSFQAVNWGGGSLNVGTDVICRAKAMTIVYLLHILYYLHAVRTWVFILQGTSFYAIAELEWRTQPSTSRLSGQIIPEILLSFR